MNITHKDANYYLHASNENIYIHHRNSSVNPSKDFILHHHPHPEIYFFISGECDFVFEGSTYTLSPYDIMIIPPYTLHQPVPKTYKPYTRYVLYVYDEFYNKLICNDIDHSFSKYSFSNAKIPGDRIKNTDIMNIFYKISKYSDNFENIDQPIIYHLVYEILYILNSITTFNTFNDKNVLVQDIIGYINANYRYIDTIKDISNDLHYSQSYISQLFKKHTGITIRDYIISKRLGDVETFVQQGETLTSACIKSGFPSYNNFAYICKQIYKKSPKESPLHKKNLI